MFLRPWLFLRSWLFVCLSACASLGLCAGLSLVDFNSISALGSAGAGRGVNGSDASVASSNPAGLVFLDRQQITVGGAVTFPGGTSTGSYWSPSEKDSWPEFYGSPDNYYTCTALGDSGATCYSESGKIDEFLKLAVIPSLYYAQPVVEDIWAGFAVYGAFGGETHYPIDSPFRYQALDSSIKVINLQPTLSWKIDDTFAVGAGVWMALGMLEMSQVLNPWSGSSTDAFANIDGDGIGLGLNLGIIWKPVDPLTLGLSYHSPTRIRFTGELKATGVAGLESVINQYSDESDFISHYPDAPKQAVKSAQLIQREKPGTIKEHTKLAVTFPEHIDLSFAWDLDSRCTLVATAIWTRWSRFERFKVISAGGLASDIVSVSNGAPGSRILAWIPQNWSDTWSTAIGAQWKYNSLLTLRTGFSKDNSPVPNTTRSARIPDNNRQWMTIGAGYKLNQQYSLDLAYGYLMIKSFSILDGRNKVDGTRQGTDQSTATYEDPGQLSARYKNMHAHVLAAQLTMHF